MNKKQLIVTSVLVSLMIILVITQSLFKEKFEQVSINANGANKSIGYNIEDGYVISLPEKWNIEQEENEGEYISYTANFNDNNKTAGTLYVINTDTDVKSFAERDLKNQTLEYSNLEMIPFKSKSYYGIQAKYDTSIKDGYKFKNTCYYLDLGNKKIAKILFNCKSDGYNENEKMVFDSIISSIEANK